MSDLNQAQETANENEYASPLDMPDDEIAKLDLDFLEEGNV